LNGALFIDRDGTIIVDTHYPRDPAVVRLLPSAASAIRTVNARSVPVVVITNQSGIGRGLITPDEYDAVHARMASLLQAEGAHVDAAYHCPHWPERDGACACRKPGLALYERAAAELGIDLARSAYVGDRWRDVEPGVRSGGLGMLVPGMGTPPDEILQAEAEARVVGSLGEAVALALPFIAGEHPQGAPAAHNAGKAR
jgi:D-glycero-D-manno-heptose 1,7-bisphosphate phosphatase